MKNIIEEARAAFNEARRSTQIAIYVTIIYLIIVATITLLILIVSGLSEFELSDLGEFLAGVFSPLAFLWIILGYKQQGDVLKHSTQALQKQNILFQKAFPQALHELEPILKLNITSSSLFEESTEDIRSITITTELKGSKLHHFSTKCLTPLPEEYITLNNYETMLVKGEQTANYPIATIVFVNGQTPETVKLKLHYFDDFCIEHEQTLFINAKGEFRIV